MKNIKNTMTADCPSNIAMARGLSYVSNEGHVSRMGAVDGIADVNATQAGFAAPAAGSSAWSPPKH